MPAHAIRGFNSSAGLRVLCVLGAAVLAMVWAAPPHAAGSRLPSEVRLAGEGPVALVGMTVIRAYAEDVDDALVLIEGSQIRAVGPAEAIDLPADVTVVDLNGHYLIPGLIDAHVHFFQSGGLYTRPDVIDLRGVRDYSEELRQIRAGLSETFRRYLVSGVTSVVDMGGAMWNLQVRAQAEATIMAPNVQVAGPLISSIARPELDTGEPPIIRVLTAEGARTEVRRQAEAGVDLIKLWYITAPGLPAERFAPVARAAAREAHARGLRVAVHATELATARVALAAGADVLVHSVFDQRVDAELLGLLRERGVMVVPTLMVRQRYRETFAQDLDLTVAEHRFADPARLASLFELRTLAPERVPLWVRGYLARGDSGGRERVAIENLRRVHAAGITVVAGTDAGNIGTPHGPALARELELMAAAGLSFDALLASATAGGAALMGRADLGAVRTGMTADLVVLSRDPRLALDNLWSAVLVVKGGHLLPVERILPVAARDVVAMQLNAYNAGDREAFLAAFSPDVVLARLGGEPIVGGMERVRARLAGALGGQRGLHAARVERWQANGEIFERYWLRAHARDPGREAVAAFTVVDGRITRLRVDGYLDLRPDPEP